MVRLLSHYEIGEGDLHRQIERYQSEICDRLEDEKNGPKGGFLGRFSLLFRQKTQCTSFGQQRLNDLCVLAVECAFVVDLEKAIVCFGENYRTLSKWNYKLLYLSVTHEANE